MQCAIQTLQDGHEAMVRPAAQMALLQTTAFHVSKVSLGVTGRDG